MIIFFIFLFLFDLILSFILSFNLISLSILFEQKQFINNINFNEQKTKHKKNIYIINNKNNSQEIKIKTNIYGNKSNYLNINSTENLKYETLREKFNKTDGNIDYTNPSNNIKIDYSATRVTKKPKIKLDKNIDNNKEKENKNNATYNFHNILHIDSRKNHKIINLTIPDINNNINENTLTKDKKGFAKITYRKINNKTLRSYQENSYDYKAEINKKFHINNNNFININK